MTRLWPPGHDMNWAVAVVVEVTISWSGCGYWWTCFYNVRLKVLGHVSRICHGQILIMLLAAWHNMAWDVEVEAAGSSADVTCNSMLLRCCVAVCLQSSNLGELWLLVVL